MIKESNIQEDIIIVYVSASNNRASKYTRPKQIDLKEDIGKSAIRVGEFNPPLSAYDRTRRQKTVRM